MSALPRCRSRLCTERADDSMEGWYYDGLTDDRLTQATPEEKAIAVKLFRTTVSSIHDKYPHNRVIKTIMLMVNRGEYEHHGLTEQSKQDLEQEFADQDPQPDLPVQDGLRAMLDQFVQQTQDGSFTTASAAAQDDSSEACGDANQLNRRQVHFAARVSVTMEYNRVAPVGGFQSRSEREQAKQEADDDTTCAASVRRSKRDVKTTSYAESSDSDDENPDSDESDFEDNDEAEEDDNVVSDDETMSDEQDDNVVSDDETMSDEQDDGEVWEEAHGRALATRQKDISEECTLERGVLGDQVSFDNVPLKDAVNLLCKNCRKNQRLLSAATILTGFIKRHFEEDCEEHFDEARSNMTTVLNSSQGTILRDYALHDHSEMQRRHMRSQASDQLILEIGITACLLRHKLQHQRQLDKARQDCAVANMALGVAELQTGELYDSEAGVTFLKSMIDARTAKLKDMWRIVQANAVQCSTVKPIEEAVAAAIASDNDAKQQRKQSKEIRLLLKNGRLKVINSADVRTISHDDNIERFDFLSVRPCGVKQSLTVNTAVYIDISDPHSANAAVDLIEVTDRIHKALYPQDAYDVDMQEVLHPLRLCVPEDCSAKHHYGQIWWYGVFNTRTLLKGVKAVWSESSQAFVPELDYLMYNSLISVPTEERSIPLPKRNGRTVNLVALPPEFRHHKLIQDPLAVNETTLICCQYTTKCDVYCRALKQREIEKKEAEIQDLDRQLGSGDALNPRKQLLQQQLQELKDGRDKYNPSDSKKVATYYSGYLRPDKNDMQALTTTKWLENARGRNDNRKEGMNKIPPLQYFLENPDMLQCTRAITVSTSTNKNVHISSEHFENAIKQCERPDDFRSVMATCFDLLDIRAKFALKEKLGISMFSGVNQTLFDGGVREESVKARHMARIAHDTVLTIQFNLRQNCLKQLRLSPLIDEHLKRKAPDHDTAKDSTAAEQQPDPSQRNKKPRTQQTQ